MAETYKNIWYWIILIIIFLFGMFNSVKWESNIYYENSTDSYNRTIEVTNKHYSENDAVPVLLFRQNSIGSHLSPEKSVMLTVIVGILMLVMFRGQDTTMLKEEHKMKSFVKNYIKSHKPDDMKLIAIFPQTAIKREKIDDNKSVPILRDVYAQVYLGYSYGDLEGERYLAFRLNPFEEKIEEILMLKEPPTSQIKCPNCGSEPDFKIITPEGMKILKEKFGIKR